jgi:protein SCO1/2
MVWHLSLNCLGSHQLPRHNVNERLVDRTRQGLTMNTTLFRSAWFFFGLAFCLIPESGTAKSNSTSIVGGAYSLVDHSGRAVTDRDFHGKFVLMFFGYTFCPDVCPTDLQIMSEALDALGPSAKKIQPLFVTLDPARDTPEVMREYVSNFHPRLIGLTGTATNIDAAAKAFRVGYYKVIPGQPPEPDGRSQNDPQEPVGAAEYLLAHSAVTYLMGPGGQFIRVFNHQSDPAAMASEIRRYLTDDPVADRR